MFKTAQVLAVMLLASATALGGLATDSNAYDDGVNPQWHGSVHMFSTGGGDTIEADVEYAVYAPGDFTYTGLGYTPTPGEFVYAYQVIPTAGSVEINTFWVNMLASNEANNIGSFTLGSIAPSSAFFGSGPPDLVSANWEFLGDTLENPGDSYGLAYSSINAPIMYVGFIQDGGLAGIPDGTLPSPSDEIPEPATMLVLAAGALLAAFRRRA